MHYLRLYRLGSTELPTFETRFWSKVDKSGDCWIWTGAKTGTGYGNVGIGRKYRGAHRVAYELHHSTKIPAGLTIDHLCRNPPCVNPDHLEVVTQRENNARNTSPVTANGKKTHCKRGHPLSGDNVRARTTKYDGVSRECRTCATAREAIRSKTRTTRTKNRKAA